MNAITEAPEARKSLTSQTGFATIDMEKAAPERMRPTMTWRIDGKMVVPSPVGSCASSEPPHHHAGCDAQGSIPQGRRRRAGMLPGAMWRHLTVGEGRSTPEQRRTVIEAAA